MGNIIKVTITEAQKELDELHKQIDIIHDKHSGYGGMCSYGWHCYLKEQKPFREQANKLYLAIEKAKDTIQIET